MRRHCRYVAKDAFPAMTAHCPPATVCLFRRKDHTQWLISYNLVIVTEMSSFKIWLEASRPKTLPAALVPVLLASALAFAEGGFRPLPAFLCLVFAVLIQVGTNFANDYLDAVKGSDTEQRIGPRRAVASGLIQPATMGRAALGILAIGFCVGLGLIPFGGWWLLVVGITSVLCAWCYTGGPYPFAYNGLGDVFVVVFFGLIATTCTYYVQVGSISGDALLLGLSLIHI